MSDYVLEGPRWPGSIVTWSFAAANFSSASAIFSRQIGSAYQATISSAFQRWSAVSGLSFTEIPDSNHVDIRVGWANFGAGSTIGYTSFSTVGGSFISDVIVRLEDPTYVALVSAEGNGWEYSGTQSTLYQVALHEIGHALGLGHSADQNAVMFPVATASNRDLDASDIAGIRVLYGDNPAGENAAPITPATLGVYRFFDKHNGTHFFTASATERDSVMSSRPDMMYEGVGFAAIDPSSADPNASPVYRFFSATDGTHFFTTSETERDAVITSRPDLVLEGTGFYEHTTQQPGDSAVYRFFDTVHGTHFYTADAGERATILATRSDLRDEGIGFYALSS